MANDPGLYINPVEKPIAPMSSACSTNSTSLAVSSCVAGLSCVPSKTNFLNEVCPTKVAKLIAGFALSIPSLLIYPDTSSVGAMETAAVELSQLHWVLMGITSVGSSLFWIVPFTFLAFQYFNLDERTKPVNQGSV